MNGAEFRGAEMPETIPIQVAIMLVAVCLAVSWISMLMGFVMGRKNGNAVNGNKSTTYFKQKDLGEEQEGDIYQEMLDGSPPEGEKRISTIE